MDLLLSNTKDQALLAFIIKEAYEVARKQGNFVGRTAIQKILYFLKVTGIETNYRFDIYHYGPFCAEILRDIDILMADGVIKDISNNPQKYSNYAPSGAIQELLQQHKDAFPTDPIQKLVGAFISMRPEELELLATLDYVYRKEKAGSEKTPSKEQVLSSFFKVKKDKFHQNIVEGVYDTMTRVGLLN